MIILFYPQLGWQSAYTDKLGPASSRLQTAGTAGVAMSVLYRTFYLVKFHYRRN